MSTIILVAILAIVVIAVFVLMLKTKKKSGEDQDSTEIDFLPVFYEKKPLTDTEIKAFERLRKALPNCIILAQVQVSQIVGIEKGKGTQAWFNKISRKSVDFLICLDDFTIVAAIEVDDKSHDNSARQAKDADKDTALGSAGIKLLRWRAESLPTSEEIHAIFNHC